MYSYPFSSLNNDSDAPASPNLPLQKIDNYAIYSVACIDQVNRRLPANYSYFDALEHFYLDNNGNIAGQERGYKMVCIPSVSLDATTQIERLKCSKFLAWQSYHIRPIPIDFRFYVETYSDLGDINPVPSVRSSTGNNLASSYNIFTEYGRSRPVMAVTKNIYGNNNSVESSTGFLLQLDKYGTYGSSISSGFLHLSNHDFYRSWFKPVYGYEDIWNDPISESFSINDGTHYNYLSPSYNGIAERRIENRVELLIDPSSNNDPFNFYAEKKFEVKGKIHQIEMYSTSATGYFLASVLDKPCYFDLVYGYRLDKRSIPQQITLVSPVNTKIRVCYYRLNPYEQFREKEKELTSLDYTDREIILKKNIPYTLKVQGIVLGTLFIDSGSINISSAENSSSYYPLEYLMYNPVLIGNLFFHWRTLFNTELQQKETDHPYFFSRYPSSKQALPSTGKNLKILTASNDYWHNSTSFNDLGYDSNHPFFNTNTNPVVLPAHPKIQFDTPGIIIEKYNDSMVSTNMIIQNHFALQQDNSYGNLTMNSPLVIEIGEMMEKVFLALEAEKYSVDENNPNEPRVATLGNYIEKIAYLLGYRPEPDGTFIKSVEKGRVKKIISKDKQLDDKKIGVTNFAEEGMVLKRINNRFKKDEIVSDQCVIVKDFPQLIGEYHEQVCLALGIQESSAVEIKKTDSTARYKSQLEMLTEVLNLVVVSNEMTRSILVSSLVTQSQSNETIAALGLPSVTKTIPVTIDKKTTQIPYKGVAAHRSISQEIATCTHNIGIVAGHLI
jgi:hypothetical protein